MRNIEWEKLIAGFMGYEFVDENPEEIPSGYYYNTKNNDWFRIGAAEYDSSLDCLMPVVEKIHDECKLPEYTYGLKYFINLSMFCGIKVLLQAVVKFIKWYNEQNEQK